MTDTTSAATPKPPGSPEALDQGCHCSFLLNDPTRDAAFVNPLCPLHGDQSEGRASSS